MTTCVGSLNELQELIGRMQPRIPLCPKAVRALFYFMRCSQLEHGEQGGSAIQVRYQYFPEESFYMKYFCFIKGTLLRTRLCCTPTVGRVAPRGHGSRRAQIRCNYR